MADPLAWLGGSGINPSTGDGSNFNEDWLNAYRSLTGSNLLGALGLDPTALRNGYTWNAGEGGGGYYAQGPQQAVQVGGQYFMPEWVPTINNGQGGFLLSQMGDNGVNGQTVRLQLNPDGTLTDVNLKQHNGWDSFDTLGVGTVLGGAAAGAFGGGVAAADAGAASGGSGGWVSAEGGAGYLGGGAADQAALTAGNASALSGGMQAADGTVSPWTNGYDLAQGPASQSSTPWYSTPGAQQAGSKILDAVTSKPGQTLIGAGITAAMGGGGASSASSQTTDPTAALNDSISKLDDMFKGRDGLYQQVYDSNKNLGMQRLNDQNTIQQRSLKFSLADRGLLGGSADIDAHSQLGKTYTDSASQVANQAQSAKDAAIQADDNTRLNLDAQIRNGLSADSAYQSAATQQANNISANSVNNDYSAVNNFLTGSAGLLAHGNAVAGANSAQRMYGNLYGGYTGFLGGSAPNTYGKRSN